MNDAVISPNIGMEVRVDVDGGGNGIEWSDGRCGWSAVPSAFLETSWNLQIFLLQKNPNNMNWSAGIMS